MRPSVRCTRTHTYPSLVEDPNDRTRKVRFAFAWRAAGSLADLEATARRAERLGYDLLLVPDHLGDQLAPLLALLAVARSTSDLRIGTMVLDNDFRHPAVLAKELATLDVLTEGRLEVGLGAGWLADEYRATGIPFDAARTRLDRLTETLQILRALFDDGSVTFDGSHYQLDGFELRPRPHRTGGPPILVGGGGPRVLGLAGRYADIVNITHVGGGLDGMDPAELTVAAFARKVAIVGDAASAAGRGQMPEIGTNFLGVSITDDAAAASRAHRDRLAALLGHEHALTDDDILASPYFLIGTVEEAAATLVRRRHELGLSYYYVADVVADKMSAVIAAMRTFDDAP